MTVFGIPSAEVELFSGESCQAAIKWKMQWNYYHSVHCISFQCNPHWTNHKLFLGGFA